MGLGSWRWWDHGRGRRGRGGYGKTSIFVLLKDHRPNVSRSPRNCRLPDGDGAGRFRAIATVNIRLRRCHGGQVFRNNLRRRQLVWIEPLGEARDKRRAYLQNWPQSRVQSRVEHGQINISEHLLRLGNELAGGTKILAPLKATAGRSLRDDPIDARGIKPHYEEPIRNGNRRVNCYHNACRRNAVIFSIVSRRFLPSAGRRDGAGNLPGARTIAHRHGKNGIR
jgi:hypothetical protein